MLTHRNGRAPAYGATANSQQHIRSAMVHRICCRAQCRFPHAVHDTGGGRGSRRAGGCLVRAAAAAGRGTATAAAADFSAARGAPPMTPIPTPPACCLPHRLPGAPATPSGRTCSVWSCFWRTPLGSIGFDGVSKLYRLAFLIVVGSYQLEAHMVRESSKDSGQPRLTTAAATMSAGEWPDARILPM